MSKKTCTNCVSNGATVSLISAESEATRQNVIIKRMIVANIVLSLLLFGTNAAWAWYESQFETIRETYEVEQETECGNNNCIIKGGEITNGSSEN